MYAEVILQLNEMRDNTSSENQMYHKEESVHRIKSDHIDRNNLRQKLQVCIDPLDPLQHPDGLVNIVTGQIISNNSSINVDEATELGKHQLVKFQQKLPGGFYEPISKIVKTLKDTL